MARSKRKKERRTKVRSSAPEPTSQGGGETEFVPRSPSDLRRRPLQIARGVSGVLLLVGLVMVVLGVSVLSGKVTEGWGFPMSAVPNWGRPWGAVLVLAGAAYVVGSLFLFVRPVTGTIVMLIVCGLGVLIGTPVITTTTEIFYNLVAQYDCKADWTKCHPTSLIDSVWGYFMIANVAVLVAIYKAGSKQDRPAQTAPTDQ